MPDNKEIAKAYEPGLYEDKIYASWEDSGFFNPDNLPGEPYTIMMPPPNVTGVLHLGHALENTILDSMIRFQRMKGRKALLVPGTDHAAIATQAKVEKVLQAQGIKNPRLELGREGLLAEVRKFSEASKSTILKQIRKMGTSCDWSRLAYTFDETRSMSVNEVFVRMYNDGLIYRGHRVINWSVKGQSTCSDDEMIHVDREAKLYTFKYSKDFPITIATTRPETKLGDTAVAVNPKDERYQQYIGQTFTVDVGALQPLLIKIIADEGVEKDFGTGALGVTPAHSAVDFEMYEKQKAKNEPIALIQVINEQGLMTVEAGKDYEGLTVLEAREKFVAWLTKQDLLEKVEDITQSVGTSDRYGDVIESLPKTQWFVDMNRDIPSRGQNLKGLMLAAVTTGHNGIANQKINISPDRYEKIYVKWIEGLRDWCISRQIWWGHRIPVWYKGDEIYCGHTAPIGDGWLQDEDTLDTWFSSGMWTFSTLGFPDNNNDLKTFHPTSWMQMGYEIFYLWMVRMILMSTYTLDQIPFKDVYIHGILRDEKGQKFSKSSGNNINPLDVISQFGTDALRLSLISGITPGNDSKYYVDKVEGARNLVNKLWNISRFIVTTFGFSAEVVARGELHVEALSDADQWILSKYEKLVRAVNDDFAAFRFSQAVEQLRDFTWNDFADWYIEVAKFEKTESKKVILTYVLTNLLKLWHPVIPFVTEVIWREVVGGEMLMVEKYPTSAKSQFNEDFEVVKNVIASIRNARAENKVEPSKKIKAVLFTINDKEIVLRNRDVIVGLKTGLNELELSDASQQLAAAIYAIAGSVEINLLGAIDPEKEIVRIKKEVAEKEKFVLSLKVKLDNIDFVNNAPVAVVAAEKVKLESAESELSRLREKLN
ncbi:MAG: valine--tRNA ligase [bacterium]